MITEFIRKLPKPVEFGLVILFCCWWALFASFKEIASRLSNTPKPAEQHITGIGVQLGERDNKVIIVQVLPHTPAADVGLSGGTVIQKIDGMATQGKQLTDCAAMIRGEAGGKVTLELVDNSTHKTNVVELARATVQGRAPPISTAMSTLIVAGLELFGLAVMFWLARVRGWPLETWGFRPSWKLTGAGVLLFVGMALLIMGVAAIANAIHPGIVHRYAVSYVSWTAVAIFSVINGVFEETLESGYFIQSLEKYGMWTAVLASACFRTFLHAYHGAAALIVIFPIGLIFGFIYWRWRRLWPLFVAHMIFDFVAFAPQFHAAR